MVWDVSFTCDICGKKKGESNHWWMVMLGDVPCWEADQPSRRFTLLPWNPAESRSADMFHLCGQGCAMQAMERFMASGSIHSNVENGSSLHHKPKALDLSGSSER
jgi:hypothetical protein